MAKTRTTTRTTRTKPEPIEDQDTLEGLEGEGIVISGDFPEDEDDSEDDSEDEDGDDDTEDIPEDIPEDTTDDPTESDTLASIQGKAIKAEQVRERARAERQLIVIPDCPSKRMEFPKFQRWYNGLTEQMKDHIAIYLYRHAPVVDNKQVDPTANKYIEKFVRLPELKYMERFHGGGTYMFIVSDETGKKGKEMCRVSLKIDDLEFEPIFDIRTLVVDHKDNRNIVRKLTNQGKLDPEGNMPNVGGIRNINQQGGVHPDLTTLLVTNLIDRVENLSDSEREAVKTNVAGDAGFLKALDLAYQGSMKNLEIMMQKLNENSPATMMDTFSKLFSIIATVQGGQKGNGDGGQTTILLEMMKMQREDQRANLELMRSMMEMNKPQANPDELTGVEKTLGILTSMRDFMGGSGGGGRGSKSSLWETVIENVAPLLGQGLTLAQQIMAARAVGGGGGGGIAGGGSVAPTTIRRADLANRGQNPGQQIGPTTSGQIFARQAQQQNEQHGQEVTQGTTMDQPTQGTEQPTQQAQQATAHDQLVNAVRAYGGFALNAMNTDQTGVDLANNIIGLGLRGIYLQLAAQGTDELVKAMKAVPEFWVAAMNRMSEDELVTFVDEFVNAEAIMAEEDEGDDSQEDSPIVTSTAVPKPQPIKSKGGK